MPMVVAILRQSIYFFYAFFSFATIIVYLSAFGGICGSDIIRIRRAIKWSGLILQGYIFPFIRR